MILMHSPVCTPLTPLCYQVFFSSSAQIDRLIETLTRDKEAGSFNIAPDRQYSQPGHSASSSMGSATDMLERMLGSMSANSS